MTTDPISDLLIRIKNAGTAKLPSTTVPYSNLKFAIATLLAKEGFIKGVSVKGKKVGKTLAIDLAYKTNTNPRIEDVVRVSKPSRRVYAGSQELMPVKQGRGMLVVSTPKGLMREKEAKAANLGGELLFKIW